MNNASEVFDQIVRSRRSVRVFDADLAFDHDAVSRSLNRAVLAPNSSNLQTWEFYRISQRDKLKQLVPICLGQNAAKTAREIVAVVVRKDLWKSRRDWVLDSYKKDNPNAPERRAKLMRSYYGKWLPMVYRTDPFRIFSAIKKAGVWLTGLTRPVYRQVGHHDARIISHKSAALAAGTFMLSMKAEGFDTCPMEGFDSVRMKKFLHLSASAEICMLIACGPGSEKGIYGQRSRLETSQVIRYSK